MARVIDFIIPRVVDHLPLDATINILKPIISTGTFPTNLCALKILIDLTERQGAQISEEQLDSIMENITKVFTVWHCQFMQQKCVYLHLRISVIVLLRSACG